MLLKPLASLLHRHFSLECFQGKPLIRRLTICGLSGANPVFYVTQYNLPNYFNVAPATNDLNALVAAPGPELHSNELID